MNTNKKLCKIFNRKDFRVGDYIDHLVSKKIMDEHWHTRMIGIDILLKDVNEGSKLIQPAVTFSDVLAKMNEGYFEYEIRGIESPKDNKIFIQYDYVKNDIQHLGAIVWQLDKDLWLQSDEIKKFIVEILTGE